VSSTPGRQRRCCPFDDFLPACAPPDPARGEPAELADEAVEALSFDGFFAGAWSPPAAESGFPDPLELASAGAALVELPLVAPSDAGGVLLSVR
jgi:hypothetical protein